MTDLTEIEKPYVFCTKEEQEGLKALVGIEGALQFLFLDGTWCTLEYHEVTLGLNVGVIYRQNPDWQPHKLDVPDWFWENTDCNSVAMDKNGAVFIYKSKPIKHSCVGVYVGQGMYRLDKLFTHDFNPHNVPWDKSLTKRPEE